MNTDTYYEDEITKLKYEYKILKDEVLRNNQQIHELQIRDMESIENMKRFLDKKRQLNNRTKRLKLLILKNYLDRRGCSMKMDEWLTALNISPEYAKPIENPYYPDPQISLYDHNLSELDASIGQKTDQFLEELRFKVENVLNTVTANDDQPKPYGVSCDDGDSDGIHIDKIDEINSDSIESIMRFFQQPATAKAIEKHDKQTSPYRPSSPLTVDQQVQTIDDSNLPVAGSGKLDYPANVEFKSLKSPPLLPSKRTNLADFATKYEIKRKHKLSDASSTTESRKSERHKSTTRHRDVGDYILHRNNISTSSFSPSNSQPPRTRLPSLLYTSIIVVVVAALFYYYPALPNCLLFLKDGVEQTRDEFARILDSFILEYMPTVIEPKIVEPKVLSTRDTVIKYLQNLYAQILTRFE